MKLTTLFSWLCTTLFSVGNVLEIGDPLPNLHGVNQKGEKLVIKSKKPDGWLLVFTYPKALTPG